jgi:hypothetical protein
MLSLILIVFAPVIITAKSPAARKRTGAIAWEGWNE